MEPIKLIALDIDGTLYNSDLKIMPKTKEALLKAQEEGVRLIIASGRPTSGVIYVAQELEMDQHHGLIVSYNGSRLTDIQTNEILFNQTMALQDAKAVLHHMKKFEVNPMVDRGGFLYVHDVYGYRVKEESEIGQYYLAEVPDLEEFISYPPNKILTGGYPEYLQAHAQEMMEPFKDRLNCMFTAPWYFEFTAKGVDKKHALTKALEIMELAPENMMAFGDGQNDTTMIEMAGVGVAMGNAIDSLKEVADYITLSHDEEGIYQALKHFGVC